MVEPLQRYVCLVCGHIYDEALGDPEAKVTAGTRLAALPDDWQCPDCGAGKEDFELDVL